MASTVDQPCSRSSFCGPLTASSNAAASRRQVDELDELLILVAADVGEAFDLPGHDGREAVASGRDRAPVVQRDGLPGLVHWKAPTGTSLDGVPMFEPNVNRCVKRVKKSTYHGSFFASESCVNAGSESMNALRGMRAYSSRQNHEPPTG
jgi:hypothetical protein